MNHTPLGFHPVIPIVNREYIVSWTAGAALFEMINSAEDAISLTNSHENYGLSYSPFLPWIVSGKRVV